MKHSLLITFLAIGSMVFGQNQLQFHVNHMVNDTELEFGSEFELDNGDIAKLTRCEYYISQISITHDGGQLTSVDNKWILVDAFSPEVYDLGEFDIENVESITFSIGVETPENHDDPTAWPASHPLAPQNPSMHWGWAAGYRFIAMEGHSGANGASETFQVHALGDVNYLEQTIEMTASAEDGILNIALDANYVKAYQNVSTASGGITHGEAGDAIDVCNNYQNDVFSAGMVVGIEENNLEELSIDIAPNPSLSGEDSKLIFNQSFDDNFSVEILDINGKSILSENHKSGVKELALPKLASGTYLIKITADNSWITKKWIVD